MIYKGIDIERKEKFIPGIISEWKLCGYDYDYGMFKSVYPRDYAVMLIHQVFSDEDISKRKFIYCPHTYRGRQSMKDYIEVYCKEKKI